MAQDMPKHVSKYLKDNGVDPKDLPEGVKQTLSGLTSGEVALLQSVGDTLKAEGVSKDVVFKIH